MHFYLGEIIIKYAVCVLAHHKPDLLNKIVSKLLDHNVEVFVHLDARCDLIDYAHIKDVTFIKDRINVHWGGSSMVVAMYRLIQYVIKYTNCNYLLFISGEDYPIITPDQYDRIINPLNNYVENKILPREDWYMGGTNRIDKYYIFTSHASIFSRMFVKLQDLLGYQKKYWEAPFQTFGGSQWININRIAAEYIIDNWENYYQFFKYCHIPDELIFQTILMNSPLKDTVVNTNFRYFYFEKNGCSPVYLDESYYEEIIASKSLFCRKIMDQASFEKIDLFCRSKGLKLTQGNKYISKEKIESKESLL